VSVNELRPRQAVASHESPVMFVLVMNVGLLLLRFNVIHLRNISLFCLQSARRSYANACVNVFQRPCLQRMSGVV